MTNPSPPRALRSLRLYRHGTRRLTRAHLALAQRPAFRAEAAKALAAVCAALGQQLGCPATAQVSLIDAEVRPARSLSDAASFALLELSARGVRAVLEVERRFLTAVLGRLSGAVSGATPAQRLTRIEEVAFGYLALVSLDAVRACEAVEKRFGPRLLRICDDRAEALAFLDGKGAHLTADVQLTVGPASGVVRATLPALALQAALQDVPPQPPPAPAPEVLAARIPVVPLMGRIQLELSELVALSPGDVAVFEGVRLEKGEVRGPCKLVGPAFDVIGEWSPNGFTVTRAGARALPEELPVSSPKPVDQTVTSLPVDVEIELTRVKLSLAELGSLKPGAVLPLRINAADPVLLRVGDRAVARAELVEIENEVGARILTLLPER